jgi:hypothetical protein
MPTQPFLVRRSTGNSARQTGALIGILSSLAWIAAACQSALAFHRARATKRIVGTSPPRVCASASTSLCRARATSWSPRVPPIAVCIPIFSASTKAPQELARRSTLSHHVPRLTVSFFPPTIRISATSRAARRSTLLLFAFLRLGARGAKVCSRVRTL